VIGAIFGQTEGLLGPDLELRELQKSGRIGRIEVELETKEGKTYGVISVPSSLDKAETAIVAAALETIERIGPCSARIETKEIEDVRMSKRDYVIERAKELLKTMITQTTDSLELSERVKESFRRMELTQFGPEVLPAGPEVATSDEIIIVEGRADVLNLLRSGFRNVIALNGTSIPKSIAELCRSKVATLFLDGDRGGDLILKGVKGFAEIDYVARAPPGREVEELTKKEIHKALRAKVPMNQFKPRRAKVEPKLSGLFSTLLDELTGTRGAYILDSGLQILGKVPVKELRNTLRDLKDVHSIILDGTINEEIIRLAEEKGVAFLAGMEKKAEGRRTITLSLEDLKP
jgi:DNA primase